MGIDVFSASKRCPLIGFGTIHPEFTGYGDEIARMKALGITGVKFQPSFQEFYPDDERMFPVYEELIKADMTILFHAGDEITPAKIVYATPQRIARMLDAMQSEIARYDYYSHGTTKIIAAHLGGYKMWDQVEEYLVGRNLFFDASYVFGHLQTERAINMMRSHGMSRILFGSDSPFGSQEKDIEAIERSEMTHEEKEMVFSQNAIRLLDL